MVPVSVVSKWLQSTHPLLEMFLSNPNKFILEYKMLQAFTKKSSINFQILENFAAMEAIKKDGYESS